MSVLTMRKKIAFFPGNLNLESVYPSSESKKRTDAVVLTATMAEFRNHCGNFEPSRKRRWR
jgi:hypothetical protein